MSSNLLNRRALDLTDQRFGRLAVVEFYGRQNGKLLWFCRCDCGNSAIVQSGHLRKGATKSCGCLRAEMLKERTAIHEMSSDPLYSVWGRMIQRCTNPNNPGYANYGGRGITVYRIWLSSFESFRDHVVSLSYYGKKGYSLDRIDNDGNYEPGNVRWATRTVQNRNSRRANQVSFRGKTQCLSEWAAEFGIKYKTLISRIHNGWSVERAFTTPQRGAR